MNKKWWLVIVIFLVVFLVFTLYLNYDKSSVIKSKKNSVENLREKNEDLKKELEQAEKEKALIQENKEQEASEIEFPQSNTFEDDVTWLVEEIYESLDRKELHDKINESITDDLEKRLFGEKEIEEKETDKVPSVQKSVHRVNFYGKYDDEETYEAVATFDLEIEAPKQTQHHFVIVKTTIEKMPGEDKWLFTEFEEIASRNKRDEN